MNDAEDELNVRRIIRTESAPMSYPTRFLTAGRMTGGENLRKNNYPHNKMETRGVSRTGVPDETDKKKSSKLEIFNDRVLGEGSFAKVFVARYKGKLVAVKIVDISKAKERHIRQFKRELDIIRILRKHPHPNIPEYYKIIESPTRIIIVMEWCRGGELSNVIKSGMDLTQVKYYFNQILSGYLHLLSLNIIHRDMKAQNIMLTHDLNQLKIIDFGLSKVINTDMTRTVVGSPAYMAPERLGAQDYDSTSDIWSLGIILYEMIYHINPFHSCKNKATLIKTANTPITLPTTRHCNEICDLELDTDPADLVGVTGTPRSRTIIRRTEPVPEGMLEIMAGMLNIDPIARYDWSELHRANERAMMMTHNEHEKLQTVMEFYRTVRKEMAERNRNKGQDNPQDDPDDTPNEESESNSNSNSRSDGSKNSGDYDPMFDMEIDEDDERHRKNSEKTTIDSDICLDGSEKPNVIQTRPRSSRAIPIPRRRNRIEEEDHIVSESLENVTGASVEAKQLECLEDYFLVNDPAIFSLYEDPKPVDPPSNVNATDSGFVDISFLDSIPFMQREYREPKPYDLIKTGSEFGSMLYSRSAPVMTGVSRLAKKAGSTLTNIISPPSHPSN